MTDAAAVDAAKRALRVRMREVRAGVAADPTDRARRSASICAAVVAAIEARTTTTQRWSRILLYEPLPGEPDPAGIAGWCAANEVVTYLPVVAGDDLLIEPGNLDAALLDVVVVPGLAFTHGGDRLGQGGGHFDRFLVGLRTDCLRVGVAFHEQVVDELPTAEHDVAVDVVITD